MLTIVPCVPVYRLIFCQEDVADETVQGLVLATETQGQAKELHEQVVVAKVPVEEDEAGKEAAKRDVLKKKVCFEEAAVGATASAPAEMMQGQSELVCERVLRVPTMTVLLAFVYLMCLLWTVLLVSGWGVARFEANGVG